MSGDLIERIDLKAEAGLCQFGMGGARAFLKDIRELIAAHRAAPFDGKPPMTLAEFCAEGERLGLTAADLADALKDRPEFADCKPLQRINYTILHEFANLNRINYNELCAAVHSALASPYKEPT